MEHEKKIILVAGPTASGKSKLAIELAKHFKGEIINADSMQIYEEISILTSKPKLQDTEVVKHHLYGFISVKKKFSTGDWLKLVVKKIKDIWIDKKVPIVVGGSGLYELISRHVTWAEALGKFCLYTNPMPGQGSGALSINNLSVGGWIRISG